MRYRGALGRVTSLGRAAWGDGGVQPKVHQGRVCLGGF